MNIRVLAFIALVSICGCSTSPDKGKGSSHTQLAPDVFEVVFSGNGFTSAEKVHDFAMLRAADVTLEKGYSHFGIIGEKDWTRVDRYPGKFKTVSFDNPRTGMRIHCYKQPADDGSRMDAAITRASIRGKYGIKG